MREFWRFVLLSISLLDTTRSQTNELDLPALLDFSIQTGSSVTFHAPASANKTYVTLNVCNLPSSNDLDILSQTTVLYAFNSTDTTQQPLATASADRGFANITLGRNKEHWLLVNTPVSSNASASWTFQLGASATEPMHIVQDLPMFEYADSGNTSALFAGPTYFPSLDDHKQPNLVMIPTDASPLSLSACFLSSTRSGVSSNQVQKTTTQRGVATLSQREGATGRALQKHNAGGVRDQFFIGGLDPGTNYTVWGLVLTDQEANNAQSISTGNPRGVKLYQPQTFVTKTTPNCRLLFEYPTCPSLAYAAPSPPELPTSNLYDLYDSLLLPHLENFNTTLYQFPCDIPSQNKFSSIRTCPDCLAAYTTWLCSVLVPRCTDIPTEQLNSAQTNYTAHQDSQVVFSSDPIPPTPQHLLIRSNPPLSRTPQFSTAGLANMTDLAAFDLTSPFPYAEIPPCSNVCNLVAASCPSSMGWSCPLSTETENAGYGQMSHLPLSQRQGGNDGGDSRWGRATDRFGNVFCNALGTDVLLNVRSSSGADRTKVGWVVVAAAAVGWALGPPV